mgnify:CR=1 FL=1
MPAHKVVQIPEPICVALQRCNQAIIDGEKAKNERQQWLVLLERMFPGAMIDEVTGLIEAPSGESEA